MGPKFTERDEKVSPADYDAAMSLALSSQNEAVRKALETGSMGAFENDKSSHKRHIK